jgi:hypothetical protein
MFWLVETEEQFERFCKKSFKEAFIEIIPYNPFIHPIQNSICAIYVRPINDTKGYLIPIYHSESGKLYEDKIMSKNLICIIAVKTILRYVRCRKKKYI